MNLKFQDVWQYNGCRIFHTNVEIGKTRHAYFDMSSNQTFGHFTQMGLCNYYGRIQTNMLLNLKKIPLIQSVHLSPYAVQISMQDGIGWVEEINHVVKDAVKEIYAELVNEGTDSSTRRTMEISTPRNCKMRRYKTNFTVSFSAIHSFQRPIRETSAQYLKKIGPKGKRVIESLLEIPGIIQVWIDPNLITVEIAMLFEWEDVEPAIIAAIEKVFGQTTIHGPTYGYIPDR